MTDSDSSEYEDESVDNDGQWFSKPPPPPHFLSKVTGRFKRSWKLPRFINANCYKFENSLLVAAKKCTHERNMQYQKQ